jgi:hypothetical protein
VIRYRFPGFVSYLHDAAILIDRPEAEAPARTIATLGALANLCAQAGAAEPEQVPAILDKAAGFRDQLHAAYEAAELILDDTRRALGISEEPACPGSEAPSHQTPRADHLP